MDQDIFANDPRAAGLFSWLVEAGRIASNTAILAEGFSERLRAAGLPLDRATVHVMILHSERQGVGYEWTPGKALLEHSYGFDSRRDEVYRHSPVREIHENERLLVLHPQETDPLITYTVTADLKAAGIVEYRAYPLFFSDGKVNVATFATARAEGFGEADRKLLAALVPLYARILEIKSQERTLSDVLRIYVGRDPGGRILSGQVRRGDVSRIPAAMLLADLRHFTELSNRLPEKQLVTLLNRFFDCFVPPIVDNGGEVLKFIGDAVLAIFPQPEGDAPMINARCRALGAAREALSQLAVLNRQLGEEPAYLEASLALHIGEVTFGNVGSIERQDFTAIGPDVNLLARLGALCASLEQPMIMSDSFARGLDYPTVAAGPYRLKGFAKAQQVHMLQGMGVDGVVRAGDRPAAAESPSPAQEPPPLETTT